MNLCSNGHDEVCFDGFDCPVCQMEADKESAIDILNDKILDLENTIFDLTAIIAEHAPEELL